MKPSDLIRLPFTHDLIEGGIAYAVRSLPHTYNRLGKTPYDHLRSIVAGITVELAFRRYLTQNAIPYNVKGATPFSEPDRYDVTLGGHRCDIQSFLITHRDQIARIHQNPGLLLEAPALVPTDQDAADGHHDDDLYFFAFLTALTAASQADVHKVIEAGQPIHLLHALPKDWAIPRSWTPLGRLALKSECSAPITLELGGQTEERTFVTETIDLHPLRRVEAVTEFYSLAGLQVKSQPDGRVAVHSPMYNKTHLARPHEWGNLWVYGMDIYLTGWMSRQEFRHRTIEIPPGSRVFQFDRTRVKNLAVNVRELRPFGVLLEKVKEWEGRK